MLGDVQSNPMKRLYTPMTAHRASRLGLRPSRGYGYVVRITPPIETVSTSTDVEGIGQWNHAPVKHVQNFHGWYKHKADAVSRATELNGV